MAFGVYALANVGISAVLDQLTEPKLMPLRFSTNWSVRPRCQVVAASN
jgi:hypothetical protein